MKKSMFSLVVTLLATCTLIAQKSLTLEGLVISESDQSKLIGASVSLNDSEDGTLTNIDGNFLLESDHPLPWNITIKYLGFLDYDLTIQKVDELPIIKMKEDYNSINKIIICPIPPPNVATKILRGRVIDKENNTPLIATSIQIKGTELSTVTDFDGFFELEIPDNIDSKKIVFSYLGYTNQEISVKHFTDELTIEMSSRVMDCRQLVPPVKKRKLFKRNKSN